MRSACSSYFPPSHHARLRTKQVYVCVIQMIQQQTIGQCGRSCACIIQSIVLDLILLHSTRWTFKMQLICRLKLQQKCSPWHTEYRLVMLLVMCTQSAMAVVLCQLQGTSPTPCHAAHAHALQPAVVFFFEHVQCSLAHQGFTWLSSCYVTSKHPGLRR